MPRNPNVDGGRVNWFRNSIVAKGLLATALSGLLIFAIASLIYDRQSMQEKRREIAESLHRIANSRARTIEMWFDGRKLLLELANADVAAHPEQAPDMAFRRSALKDNFLVTYFGNASNGAFSQYPDSPLPKNYDPRTRPWFKAAHIQRKPVLIEPYMDPGINAQVVTIATPQYSNGTFRGVTAADFSLTSLVAMLQRSNMKGSYTFLANDHGQILVHPDPRMIGKTLSVMFDGKAPALSEDVSYVRQGGVEKIVRFAAIPGLPSAHWYVAIVLDKSVAYAQVQETRLRSTVQMALMMLACFAVVGLTLSRLVLNPLAHIVASVRHIAQGQHDIAIHGAKRQDEIGEIARAVAELRDNSHHIAVLTQTEADRLGQSAAARSAMLTNLQRSFGLVVEAAVKGDFSRRVEAEFEDVELTTLASSINLLVETIDRGLSETGAVLAAMAKADLSKRVEGRFEGGFEKLKHDTNAVADKLDNVIGQLGAMSVQLKNATQELSFEAIGLSDRSRDQTLVVQNTAASIQQLTIVARQSLESVSAASRRADDAALQAEVGSATMDDALRAMERLNSASSTISSIITMIDQIATQTSLLALNATIEAARAGDAGNGFSVVAAEVQMLAASAKHASHQASQLVEQTLIEVATGSQMMSRVGENLTSMLESVKVNSDHLNMIANASREQTASISHISDAISRLENIGQDNLVLVDGLRSATNGTQARAMEIDEIIETFRNHR